jgi:ferredoxin-NADP reductase/Na+-translocating ferredoxin:NAD+ oxidoreductase RnfD subunit
MLALIDRLLNRITMYRLVLYFLIILLAVAAIFGALGMLPYSPLAIIFSTLFLVVACWIVNIVFAKIFHAQPNTESVYITALILALIITPGLPTDTATIWFLLAASVIAMASKYILAASRKHIFNPAAFAVAVTGLALGQYASWWVGGNLPMMAFVIVGGLLVVRKIQRFDLVLAFLAAAAASCILLAPTLDPLDTIQKLALHTPIFFFAFIMLTEPLTTPPTRSLRIAYGVLVGAIFSPYVHIGPIYSIPELALVVGNVFAYAVSPKRKYMLTLREKREAGSNIYDFAFTPDRALSFRPGQYVEWTLAHARPDGRGNRRYFTIASSPTENDVHLGAKFYDPSSSFKKHLLAMNPGEKILAGQLAGDFTLPRNPEKKLAFVAGGIGITPFRSMVKYLTDMGEKRDVTLFYSNRTNDEISYREIFGEAEAAWGLKTVYAVTDANQPAPAHNGVHGRIDAELIKRTIPDYRERMFYISGTHAMVSTFKKTLAELGIPRTQIKTDFFPGFA